MTTQPDRALQEGLPASSRRGRGAANLPWLWITAAPVVTSPTPGRHFTHARSSFRPREVVISPTNGRHFTHARPPQMLEIQGRKGCDGPFTRLWPFAEEN